MIPIELRGFISLNPTTCIYYIAGRSQREVSIGRLGGGLWGDIRCKAQVEVQEEVSSSGLRTWSHGKISGGGL